MSFRALREKSFFSLQDATFKLNHYQLSIIFYFSFQEWYFGSLGENVATEFWDRIAEQNPYLHEHVSRLLVSFTHWTGKGLIETDAPMVERARRLFYAPFVVLSHNTAPDPILNYANRQALDLFELTWEELIALPSRKTAEPGERKERERLLATVSRQGYIDDYRGVRISKNGRRFLIERATVWNLLDDAGAFYGQAATFSHWKFLD